MNAAAPVSSRPPRSIHPPAPLSAPMPGGGGFFARLRREPNAIFMREMRQAARLGRTPWILFSLTLAITLLLSSIGGLVSASHTSPASIGGTLFQVFFSLAYLVVIIVGPAVAANAIAAEREGRTWEAVLLTGLTPKEIARGKFLAAYATIAIYITALAPVGALSFLFGGVTALEVVVAFVFLFIIAALAVAFGLAVSSMTKSLRGALVLTLILAILIGPFLYFLGGSGASFAIHREWSAVPDGLPVWLPLAYERATFGARYLTMLVAIPLLLILAPAWLLYELTIASLTGEADDRSTGLRTWFVVTAPMFALASAAPSLLAHDDEGRAWWCIFGVCTFMIYAMFAVFLFAFEPPGPSRRVRVHWKRANVSALRRFFGPGLMKASLLVGMLGAVGLVAVAALGMGALFLFGASAKKVTYFEEVFVFTAYVVPFFVFVLGLTSWLRAKNPSAWVARLVSGGVLFLVSAVPWVVAAIGGVIAHSPERGWLAIASPSPFYAFTMLGAVDWSGSMASDILIPAGLFCAAGWGFIGVTMLTLAGRRTAKTMREHSEAVKQAEDAFAAEAQREADARVQPRASA